MIRAIELGISFHRGQTLDEGPTTQTLQFSVKFFDSFGVYSADVGHQVCNLRMSVEWKRGGGGSTHIIPTICVLLVDVMIS